MAVTIGAGQVRAHVLAAARRSETSWTDMARDLLTFRGHWNELGNDVTWHQLGSGVTWESVQQQGLFDIVVDAPDVTEESDELLRLSDEGIEMVLCAEDDFPHRLTDAKQVPPFLFKSGEFQDQDAAAIAIVGSRKASDVALLAASQLARQAVDSGLPVASGLAAGIDTAALVSALDAGGRVIAVIGTGITRAYPRENAALQQRIADVGLLLSQFLPEASPSKVSFPMRNAVMSAYSAGTLVIQADERSGARLQARLAHAQGRSVYLYEPIMCLEPWAVEFVAAGKGAFVTNLAEVSI